MAAAAPVIRANDPGCTIVGGVTSGIDQAFLTTCFNNGMLSQIDAVSVHPYRIDIPESINSEITTLRNKMNTYANGSNVRIWTGEWGYNVGWSELDEEGQAKMLTRMMVNNLAQGIGLSVWFSVHGWDPIEDWGLTPWNQPGVARASHQAMKVVNQRLPFPLSVLSNPYSVAFSPTQSTYRSASFERGSADHRTAAVWRARSLPVTTSPITADVTLTVAPQFRLRGYDGLTGNELALDTQWNLGQGRVTLKGFPMFDHISYVDLDREVLPAGTKLAPAQIAGYQADSEFTGFGGNLAYDGTVSVTAKWVSASTAPPHWLALQLAQPQRVTGFAVRFPSLGGEMSAFNARSVSFQTGPSLAGPWTTVASVSNPLQYDRAIAVLGAEQQVQFVRLLVTDAGIDAYARIPEFEVYSAGPVTSGVGAFEGY